MLCPHCSKEIFFEESYSFAHLVDEKDNIGIGVSSGICPSCEEPIFVYQKGFYNPSTSNYSAYLTYTIDTKILYPFLQNQKKLHESIPKFLSDDYHEAQLVLPYSPKASAALSRRCLQNFFHNKLAIKGKNLSQEIDLFIEKEKCPSYVLDAIDAIRNIGNFAAHPLKENNTGEIVPVEPGEAEWLIEILELLFDFYFIVPEKMAEKKATLNRKLESLGKPPMK